MEKKFPKVGDTVLVKHRTTQSLRGDVKLEAGSPVVQTVKHVMLGGAVVVRCGDLWDVIPDPTGKAEWTTYDPQAKPKRKR